MAELLDFSEYLYHYLLQNKIYNSYRFQQNVGEMRIRWLDNNDALYWALEGGIFEVVLPQT